MLNQLRAGRLRRRVIWLVEARSASAAVMHTLVARFGVLGINLATGLIVARTLGPKGRGEQGAMALWAGVISGLLTMGLPAALRYYVSRDREHSDDLFSVALIYGTVLGFIGVAIGVIGIPHWLSQYDPKTIRFAQWLMLLAPAVTIAWILQAFLEARGDFRQSNFIVYIPPAATLLTLLALLVLHHMSPSTSALAYAVPPVFLSVWRSIGLRRHIRLSTRGFGKTTKRLFRYGIGAYGLDVLGMLGPQIFQALQVKFLTPAEFGAYGVAYTVARLPAVLSNSIMVVLLPRASALEPDVAVALIARVARLTIAGTAVSNAILALLVPKVLPLLYGHKYVLAVGVTQILCLQMTIGATGVLTQAFLATGKPTALTILQAVGLATTLPFTVILIPHFGFEGAAYAALCSQVVRFGLQLASYPIFLKRPPPNLILQPADIRYAIAAFRSKGRAGPEPSVA